MVFPALVVDGNHLRLGLGLWLRLRLRLLEVLDVLADLLRLSTLAEVARALHQSIGGMPDIQALLSGLSLGSDELFGVRNIRGIGVDLGVALAHQLQVDEGVANVEVTEETAVFIPGGHVHLDSCVLAQGKLLGELGCLRAPGALCGLRRIDADQANLLRLPVGLDGHSVAISHFRDDAGKGRCEGR